MQIGHSYANKTVVNTPSYGNNVPAGNKALVEQSTTTVAPSNTSYIRDLASKIDPSNMSRNDAAEIGHVLAMEGENELAMQFIAQSLILVEDNGEMRTAGPDDAIMKQKFNMFDSLKSQMEFYRTQGQSTEILEKMHAFLEKLDSVSGSKPIDAYA